MAEESEQIKKPWRYPRWLEKRRRGLPANLFILAALVGVLAGLGASLLKTLFTLAPQILSGTDSSFLNASILPWYRKLLIPAGGGLIAGLFLYLLPKEAKGQGISEIMEAVTIRGGQLNFRASMIRTASSLMSLGTGASIGREGSIIQVSAALASKVGQLLRVKKENLSILVGCGVAAGLAAVYNVPISASFFVMEIIIGNFAIDIFAPLVISSVVSNLIYRELFGNEPVYGTPHFALISNWEILAYVALGVLGGIAATLLRESLKLADRTFSKIRLPVFVKLGIGGLLLGAIGIWFPHVWGNGFGEINQILNNRMTFGILLVLFYLKIVATSISVGSGASGGVFTPTQFVGACLGGFLGYAVYAAFPERVALPSAYALVGMGCLMAGTTQAPIMAIMMVFEMTLNYEIILPLMLSCIISSTVARQFNRDSIYTESLRKKGIRFDLSLEERALRSIHVGDLKRSDVPVVKATERFSDVVDTFLKSRSNVLYVVGEDRSLIGSIDIHDLKEFMGDKALASVVIANDIAKPASFAFPEQPLIDVMDSMYLADMEQMPVVKDGTSKKFEGVISRRDIIGAYNREVLKKKILLTKFVTRKKEKEGIDFMEMPPGYRLGKIIISDSMDNKTLAELMFHSRYRLQVLECIRSEEGATLRLMAEPHMKLKQGDALIVIGREEDFQRYQNEQ